MPRGEQGSPRSRVVSFSSLSERRLPVASGERHTRWRPNTIMGSTTRQFEAEPSSLTETIPDSLLARRRASQSSAVTPSRESVRRVGLPGVATARVSDD